MLSYIFSMKSFIRGRVAFGGATLSIEDLINRFAFERWTDQAQERGRAQHQLGRVPRLPALHPGAQEAQRRVHRVQKRQQDFPGQAQEVRGVPRGLPRPPQRVPLRAQRLGGPQKAGPGPAPQRGAPPLGRGPCASLRSPGRRRLSQREERAQRAKRPRVQPAPPLGALSQGPGGLPGKGGRAGVEFAPEERWADQWSSLCTGKCAR